MPLHVAQRGSQSRVAARSEGRSLSRRDVIRGLTTATLLTSVSPLAHASDVPQKLMPMSAAQSAAMQKVLAKNVNKVKAPILLRLAFHDSGTYSAADGSGGPNASIQYELDRPENKGLKRGLTTVNEVKQQIQGTAAESLSRADIIALLGAEGVKACSGPAIPPLVGRLDATSMDPEGRLPDENASISVLKANFARQGFSTQEFVCLCGAHTLGSKGFGDPGKFDNAYYTALLKRPWLNKFDSMAEMIGLPSDHVLPDDEECLEWIKVYAGSQEVFEKDFVAAYTKITSLGYA